VLLDMVPVFIIIFLLLVMVVVVPRILGIASVDVVVDHVSFIQGHSTALDDISEETLPFILDEINSSITTKNFGRAEDLTNQVLAVYPLHHESLVLHTSTMLASEQYAKAELSLRRLIVLEQEVLQKRHHASLFSKFLHRDEQPNATAISLAKHLVLLGNTLEKLDKNMPSPQEEIQELKSSFDAYETAIAVDTNNAEAFLYLGKLKERLDFPSDEWIPLYMHSFKIDPSLSELGIIIANDLIIKNDYAQAALYFNKILHRSPNNAKAHAGLGIAYMMQNNFTKARENFEQSVQAGIDDASVYSNLATTCMKTEDLGSAVIWHEKALSLEESALRHAKLAEVFFQLDRKEESLEHYQRAAALEQDNIRYHFGIATIASAIQQDDLALLAWKKILSLEPENPEAQKALGIESNESDVVVTS